VRLTETNQRGREGGRTVTEGRRLCKGEHEKKKNSLAEDQNGNLIHSDKSDHPSGGEIARETEKYGIRGVKTPGSSDF